MATRKRSSSSSSATKKGQGQGKEAKGDEKGQIARALPKPPDLNDRPDLDIELAHGFQDDNLPEDDPARLAQKEAALFEDNFLNLFDAIGADGDPNIRFWIQTMWQSRRTNPLNPILNLALRECGGGGDCQFYSVAHALRDGHRAEEKEGKAKTHDSGQTVMTGLRRALQLTLEKEIAKGDVEGIWTFVHSMQGDRDARMLKLVRKAVKVEADYQAEIERQDKQLRVLEDLYVSTLRQHEEKKLGGYDLPEVKARLLEGKMARDENVARAAIAFNEATRTKVADVAREMAALLGRPKGDDDPASIFGNHYTLRALYFALNDSSADIQALLPAHVRREVRQGRGDLIPVIVGPSLQRNREPLFTLEMGKLNQDPGEAAKHDYIMIWHMHSHYRLLGRVDWNATPELQTLYLPGTQTPFTHPAYPGALYQTRTYPVQSIVSHAVIQELQAWNEEAQQVVRERLELRSRTVFDERDVVRNRPWIDSFDIARCFPEQHREDVLVLRKFRDDGYYDPNWFRCVPLSLIALVKRQQQPYNAVLPLIGLEGYSLRVSRGLLARIDRFLEAPMVTLDLSGAQSSAEIVFPDDPAEESSFTLQATQYKDNRSAGGGSFVVLLNVLHGQRFLTKCILQTELPSEPVEIVDKESGVKMWLSLVDVSAPSAPPTVTIRVGHVFVLSSSSKKSSSKSSKATKKKK